MKFKAFALILTLALGLLAAPVPAEGQKAGRVYQLGYLSNATPAAAAYLLEVFRQRLRELGYVESQNIAIEYRFGEGRSEDLPDLAANLVRLKVDVIVTVGTPATRAAKNATGTIPIVVAAISDPVRSGFVASLARPGANITGLSMMSLELAGKRLELLKEAVPGLTRVAVLWNPNHAGVALSFRETKVAARALGVQLQSLEVRGPNEFERAFQAAIQGRAGALDVLPDLLTFRHRTRIADLASKNRLPATYALREFVEAGGLMSYGVHLPDLYRRAATYVDKILKGAKPADLPLERPTKFELVINLNELTT